MSEKNPTRGQQKAACYYESQGTSREEAIRRAVREKGPDQPQRSTHQWSSGGSYTGSSISSGGYTDDYADQESDW